MALLIRGDLLQVGVEGVVHAGVDKVGASVVLQALGVEGGLEVLQCQGIVKDVRCEATMISKSYGLFKGYSPTRTTYHR